MAGILILIVLQSGPSEDNEEDVLELSDDSDQRAFSKVNTMALFHHVSSTVQCRSFSEAFCT